MILLIDNYDSFTYNLYQYLCELGAKVRVERNDRVTLEDISQMAPERIVISPGPCAPPQAGISNDVVRQFGPHIPLLGVCLGHQCVGYAFGARVGLAGEIMHGKLSNIYHDGQGLFQGVPNPFPAIRYHSLATYRDGMPGELEITAWTEKGLVMGLRHKKYPIATVQFHPESIMTQDGKTILRNFLAM